MYFTGGKLFQKAFLLSIMWPWVMQNVMRIILYYIQVSNIIRNLSLEKKNVVILGENKLLLMYVTNITCVHISFLHMTVKPLNNRHFGTS